MGACANTSFAGLETARKLASAEKFALQGRGAMSDLEQCMQYANGTRDIPHMSRVAATELLQGAALLKFKCAICKSKCDKERVVFCYCPSRERAHDTPGPSFFSSRQDGVHPWWAHARCLGVKRSDGEGASYRSTGATFCSHCSKVRNALIPHVALGVAGGAQAAPSVCRSRTRTGHASARSERFFLRFKTLGLPHTPAVFEQSPWC